MRTATALRVPVVPQGARTGLSGGGQRRRRLHRAVARRRWTGSWRSTRSTGSPWSNPASSTRCCPGPSANTGLYYPPDPSSWETCTIGGNIGTGAGGLCCVKYGVTAEYVLGLDVVLADGRLLTTGRRTAKGVAGLRPDPAVRRLRGHASASS